MEESFIIKDGILTKYNGNKTKIVIPNEVLNIKNKAFFGCISLSNITIPDGVISLGDGSFEGCTSLTSIEIPNSVLRIGK